MQNDWQSYLTAAGAIIREGYTESFGNPTRERKVITSEAILADLSHLGLIAVQGEDAQKFLMSQFTHDVSRISPSQAQLNGYCTPKGRLLAIFHILQRHGIYYLQTPRELIPTLLKRLRMFILNAKVTLEDASDSVIKIGYSSTTNGADLARAVGGVPQEILEVYEAANLTVIRLHGPTLRYELIGELPAMQTLWEQLAANATLVGAPAWEALDILAGIPLITSATSEAFVPQMVNLDLVDGVSFKKGCYPGQEIVARMKYLGKLKRRMYLARCSAASSCPAPGTHVQSSEAGTSTNVGMVLHSRPAHDGGCYLLATLDIERAQQQIHLDGQPDWILKLMELPYAVDEHQERS